MKICNGALFDAWFVSIFFHRREQENAVFRGDIVSSRLPIGSLLRQHKLPTDLNLCAPLASVVLWAKYLPHETEF
jgi:hypothetical protein